MPFHLQGRQTGLDSSPEARLGKMRLLRSARNGVSVLDTSSETRAGGGIQGSIIKNQKDTVPQPSFVDHQFDGRRQFVQYLISHNRIFEKADQPVEQFMPPVEEVALTRDKTNLFYVILGVFSLLALLRLGFRKYFQDLFRAFFSPTLSNRQLREQLYQTPFPAFALNLFFTISLGLYLYLVLLHTGYLRMEYPLYLLGVFVFLFIIVYLVKFLLLRLCGWLFGLSDLMDHYVFTLFLINKVLGVILLPFALLIAFSTPGLSALALDISIVGIILLVAYRYIRVFPLVKSQFSFSKFHFFLYLCGFEIAPILIIGKLTLIWLNGAS